MLKSGTPRTSHVWFKFGVPSWDFIAGIGKITLELALGFMSSMKVQVRAHICLFVWVGRFIWVPDFNTNAGGKSTITHTDNDPKSQMKLVWRPTRTDTEYYFQYTIVKDYNNIWVARKTVNFSLN